MSSEAWKADGPPLARRQGWQLPVAAFVLVVLAAATAWNARRVPCAR